MRNILFLMIFSGLFACKSKEIIPQKISKVEQKSESGNYQIQEKLSIIPKQKLSVVKNEMGQNYLKTLPGQHIVLKYSYIQTPKDTGLMDARYTQNIWFEIKDKAIKTAEFKTQELQKNPLYVQIYGFRNAKLIPVTNADVHIKVINKHMAELSIDIKDNNMLIHQKQIKQTLKF